MATGDAQDFAARLQAVLPAKWFPNGASPVVTGILTGIGSAFAYAYGLIVFTRTQARIATATDAWLDAASVDFNGGGLPRLPGEQDAAFSARIQANMFAARGTRQAMETALLNLTGNTPKIFEPLQPMDCGGYGTCCGYNKAGAYGSLARPMQTFITAYRTPSGGIPLVFGYGSSAGGYGKGAIEYASLSQVAGEITDEQIQDTITSMMPAGYTAWMNITPLV